MEECAEQSPASGGIPVRAAPHRGEAPDPGGPRIAYVTIAFPKDSEAFACLEVRALKRFGAKLSVHALLPATPYEHKMLAAHELQDLARSSGGWRASLRGVFEACKRPVVTGHLLGFIAHTCWTQPREAVRSLAVAARVLAIYAEIESDPCDVVHLYWGHYPALLGRLVQRFHPEIVVSTSLGAYDLLLEYPPSLEVARSASFVRTLAQTNVEHLVTRGVPRDRVLLSRRGIESALPSASEDSAAPPIAGRVATASRLIPGKRVDLVLRRFAELREARADATLEIFGEGPERGALERLAQELGLSDAVSFRGHVPQPELYAALSPCRSLPLLESAPFRASSQCGQRSDAARLRLHRQRHTRDRGTRGRREERFRGRRPRRGAHPGSRAQAARKRRTQRSEDSIAHAARQQIAANYDLDRNLAPMLRIWNDEILCRRGRGLAFARRDGLTVSASTEHPRRLLVVSASLAEGGAERFASRLLSGLDRKRFRPSLALFRDRIDYVLPEDVSVALLEQRSPLSSLRTLRRLRRLIEAQSPETLLSCGAYTNLFVGEALRGLACAPRWVARVGNDPALHPTGRTRRFVHARLRQSYGRAQQVVANSQGLCTAVKQHFPLAADHCSHIPNPVDLQALREAAKQHCAASASPRTPRFTSPRSPARTKSAPRCCFLALAALRSDSELWFCGEGPARPALESEATERGLADRVRFLGFQPEPAPFILAADLIVSASAHEGLPNALIEAQALGKAVVAAHCDYGVDEVIADGESGTLIRGLDGEPLSAAIAAAVDHLLENPAKLAGFGAAAAQQARRFDADGVMLRWQALLEGAPN